MRQTIWSGLRINLFVTFAAIGLVQLFSLEMMMLFHPASADVIEEGVLYLRICCGMNSLVYAMMYTFDSFAIGVGSGNIALGNALLDAVVVRLPICWLLAFTFQFGFIGVYIGQALSPVLPAIVGTMYFVNKKWQSKQLVHE